MSSLLIIWTKFFILWSTWGTDYRNTESLTHSEPGNMVISQFQAKLGPKSFFDGKLAPEIFCCGKLGHRIFLAANWVLANGVWEGPNLSGPNLPICLGCPKKKSYPKEAENHPNKSPPKSSSSTVII